MSRETLSVSSLVNSRNSLAFSIFGNRQNIDQKYSNGILKILQFTKLRFLQVIKKKKKVKIFTGLLLLVKKMYFYL